MSGGGDRRSYARCSFCGKGQDKVRKLVAGPGVFICDQCIDLSKEILDAENLPPPAAAESRSSTRPVPPRTFGLTTRELESANLFAHGLGVEAIGHCVGLNSRAVQVFLIRACTRMSSPPNVSVTTPDRSHMRGWLNEHGLLSDPAESEAVVVRALSALENGPNPPRGLSRRERQHLEKHLATEKALLLEAVRALREPPPTEN
jgi:hypothetical protein